VGLQSTLHLGNLDALRDWGHARDYVEAQWLILQQAEPDDFVIATGKQRSVRDFVEIAARELGMTLAWEGTGVDEVARVARNDGPPTGPRPGDVIVRIDPRYFRPTEVETLLGDPTKAREKLGWAASTPLEDLVREMVAADLSIAERDALVAREGYRVFRHHE
jgi:GDPmannose 4,6-dehydratase